MLNMNLSTSNHNLTLRYTLQCILAMMGYLVLGFVIFLASYSIYLTESYQSYDFIYQIVQIIKFFFYPLVALYVLVGFSFIIFHFLKKPYIQMNQLMSASRSVYNTNELLPELPSNLIDYSVELAEIKLRFQQNERAAKEAEQRKNDLVVYLAHDLKTPLTSVIGYLTLLTEEPDISTELRAKYNNIALEKALRLEDLINEFFDITRFNLTTLTMEPRNINLSMMLEQLTYEFKPMLSSKELTLDLDCPANFMYTCDPDKMQRVFDNLLRNAVNYCYPSTAISMKVHMVASSLHIDIVNQGQTIIPEKLSRIFEQFYRLDSSRSTNSGGAGLGLAISKEIIEFHGGTITAESHDELILFHIILPL